MILKKSVGGVCVAATDMTQVVVMVVMAINNTIKPQL